MSYDHIVLSAVLSGLAVRVSALRLGGRGSILGRVIPKTEKMGPNVSLLGTHHQWLDWGVRSPQIIPVRGTAPVYRSKRWVKCGEQILHTAMYVTNSGEFDFGQYTCRLVYRNFQTISLYFGAAYTMVRLI